MRAPGFWWRPGGGRLLAPLGELYGAAAALRLRAPGIRVGVPVICLGNPTLGGGGKTPAALAVARMLLAAHHRPFFLSRGYGGRVRGPVRIDPDVHSAVDVGDEPLLLARVAPTVVSRDRPAGARIAIEQGASVIVMDDGFQNPSLMKDLACLLIDGRRGLGNGRIFPAGPLRAPLDAQIARAHALIIVGDGMEAERPLRIARRHGIAIFHARLEPDAGTLATLRGVTILAFAGIADPEKFFVTLAQAGLAVEQRATFADHHPYTAIEARRLLARAEAEHLTLLTTEKDLVRLQRDPRTAILAGCATALPVQLEIAERNSFRDLILMTAGR